MIRQNFFYAFWMFLFCGISFGILNAQIVETNLKDLNLGCIRDLSAIPSPDPEGVKVRTTNCEDEARVEYIDDLFHMEGCRYTILRLYQIDVCRNQLVDTQIIRFIYEEIPDSNDTVFIDLGCNPNLKRDIPNPRRFDPGHCRANVEWQGDQRNSNDCYFWLTRSYTITLCSGGSYVLTQVYHWLEDTTPPTIICEDLDLGCNPDSIPSIFDIPVKDNCGEVEIINPTSSIVQNGCSFIVTQTITAVDHCGNQSTCTRTIKYRKDDEPPVVQRCNRVIDLGCIDNITEVPAPLPAPIVITDNCSTVEVKVTDKIPEEEECKSRMTYVYEIYDDCGNSTSCKITYEWILDTISPVIDCPEEVDLGCNPTSIPGPDATRIKAKDNCGIVDTLYAIADYLPDGCVYRVGYLYTFIDGCGNKSSCLEVFRWTLDNDVPIVSGCGDVINVPIVDGKPDIPPPLPAPFIITDNCGGILPLEWTDTRNDFGCSGELIRTYTISDSCGNQSQCEIIYVWESRSCLSQIKCKDPMDLGCNPNFPDDFPQPDVDSYLRLLDCEVRVEVLPDIDIVVVGCEYRYGYTLIFTDECGNQKKCREEYFWISDFQAPRIVECAPDIKLGCISDLNEFPGHDHSDKIIATDNCTDYSVHLASIQAVSSGCEVKYRQFYTVQDECGNEATCIQHISYTYDPGLQIPEDLTVFCTIPDPPLIQGSCAKATLKLIYQYDTGCDDNNCKIYRYWQLVNCEGEVEFGVQTITVECNITGEPLTSASINKNRMIEQFRNEKASGELFSQPEREPSFLNTSEWTEGQMIIYPNPAGYYIFLSIDPEYSSADTNDLNIYDQYGRLVKSQKVEGPVVEYEVRIDDLPAGMYVVVLNGKENSKYVKSFVRIPQ